MKITKTSAVCSIYPSDWNVGVRLGLGLGLGLGFEKKMKIKQKKALYAAFIPVIGMLGSGLTGSTTTSNFLFGQLQVETSIELGLIRPGYNSVWEIAGGQVFGASAGEIISPMNAVFSTLLLSGLCPNPNPNHGK